MLTLCSPVAHGVETFLGPTSAMNRFVVGTNEAILITKWVPSNQSDGCQIVKDGVVYVVNPTAGQIPFSSELPSPSSPSAIGGPCELIFTNGVLINFQRLATASITTTILAPLASTNKTSVTVASGQTLRLFRGFPYRGLSSAPIAVARGTNSFGLEEASFFANDEFGGPLTLTFFGPVSGTFSYLFSYALTDSAQAVPQGVTLQSPTGAFQLEIEKSTNLTNWVPAIIQSLREDQKAYYRLRITK